jgi:hypothetical protein
MLHEYWITLNVQVDAHDSEEAVEIGHHLSAVLKTHSNYKLTGVELTEIEEA